jgi:uncharacterized membrane protein
MSTPSFVLPSVIMILIIGLLVVLYYVMPRLTRPDIYFAVTVTPDFRDSAEGGAILGRYRVEVVVYGIIAIAVALSGLWMSQPSSATVSVVGLVLQPVGAFIAYYRARRRVLPHAVAPATIREAALAPHEVRLPGGWAVQIGPFAVLAAVAAWLQLHWSEIPDRFPVHWGINGQPDNWATRSFTGVFFPLLTAAFFCALLGFLAYAILRWSRVIRMGGAAGESEQHFRRTVVLILVATEYFLALLFAWTGLLALSAVRTGPPGLVPILVLSLGFTLVVTLLLVRAGQGGSRLAGAAASGTVVPVGDRTADQYWKLGVFYVNRDDPALMVEKRFGIGYTMNFGHPGAWLVIGTLVAVAVLIGVVAPSHH